MLSPVAINMAVPQVIIGNLPPGTRTDEIELYLKSFGVLHVATTDKNEVIATFADYTDAKQMLERGDVYFYGRCLKMAYVQSSNTVATGMYPLYHDCGPALITTAAQAQGAYSKQRAVMAPGSKCELQLPRPHSTNSLTPIVPANLDAAIKIPQKSKDAPNDRKSKPRASRFLPMIKEVTAAKKSTEVHHPGAYYTGNAQYDFGRTKQTHVSVIDKNPSKAQRTDHRIPNRIGIITVSPNSLHGMANTFVASNEVLENDPKSSPIPDFWSNFSDVFTHTSPTYDHNDGSPRVNSSDPPGSTDSPYEWDDPSSPLAGKDPTVARPIINDTAVAAAEAVPPSSPPDLYEVPDYILRARLDRLRPHPDDCVQPQVSLGQLSFTTDLSDVDPEDVPQVRAALRLVGANARIPNVMSSDMSSSPYIDTPEHRPFQADARLNYHTAYQTMRGRTALALMTSPKTDSSDHVSPVNERAHDGVRGTPRRHQDMSEVEDSGEGSRVSPEDSNSSEGRSLTPPTDVSPASVKASTKERNTKAPTQIERDMASDVSTPPVKDAAVQVQMPSNAANLAPSFEILLDPTKQDSRGKIQQGGYLDLHSYILGTLFIVSLCSGTFLSRILVFALCISHFFPDFMKEIVYRLGVFCKSLKTGYTFPTLIASNDSDEAKWNMVPESTFVKVKDNTASVTQFLFHPTEGMGLFLEIIFGTISLYAMMSFHRSSVGAPCIVALSILTGISAFALPEETGYALGASARGFLEGVVEGRGPVCL
jgi:hypothetical protein